MRSPVGKPVTPGTAKKPHLRSKSWGAMSVGSIRGTGGDTSDGRSDSDDEDFDTDVEEDPDAEPDFPLGVGSSSRSVGGCDKSVLWVLKSGEEAKLEGLDLMRSLHVRVGFAPLDDYSSVR